MGRLTDEMREEVRALMDGINSDAYELLAQKEAQIASLEASRDYWRSECERLERERNAGDDLMIHP